MPGGSRRHWPRNEKRPWLCGPRPKATSRFHYAGSGKRVVSPLASKAYAIPGSRLKCPALFRAEASDGSQKPGPATEEVSGPARPQGGMRGMGTGGASFGEQQSAQERMSLFRAESRGRSPFLTDFQGLRRVFLSVARCKIKFGGGTRVHYETLRLRTGRPIRSFGREAEL